MSNGAPVSDLHKARDPAGIADPIAFGPFRLSPQARLLERDGEPVPLGSRALDLLCLLASRPGEVVRKDELMAKAWPDLTVDESSLRFHIAQLRRTLAGQEGERYVANVPGRGYCFVAPILPSDARPAPAQPFPAPSPRALPAPPADVVGRDRIIREIAAGLNRDRFITLCGVGGIGKTTVAVALAHDVWADFRGEVRFLDLSSVKDPSLVATVAATALGLAIQSPDPASSLVDMLRDRRMLLVLDSCEHVIEAVATLAERIYLQAPAVSLLVTSREALGAQGERVVDLPPLDTPADSAALSAVEVLSYSAARLLVDRAAAAGYLGEIGDEEARIVADICRKVDGIALALELAAGRVRVHGLRETARLLDGPLRLLWRGRRTAPARHQTLGATLDWSYELIPDIERRVLQRLAVLAGPFGLQDALAVAVDETITVELATEALEQLVVKSLVSAAPDRPRARYRLLDTTRAYALDKLTGSGDARRTAVRHALHLSAELERTAGHATSEDLSAERSELLADARAALAWAFSDDGEADLRVRLAAACVRLFIEHGLLMECCAWARRGLAALDTVDLGDRAELELQSALGHASMFTVDDSEQTEAALRRGLAIAEELGDAVSASRLLWRMHNFYLRTGRYDRLLPTARRNEDVSRQIGDAAGVARAHSMLGVSLHLTGDASQALEHMQTALAILANSPPIGPGHFAFPCFPEVPFTCALWVAGFPDRAVDVATALATTAPPRDRVMHLVGLSWAAAVFRWVGDWVMVDQLADQLGSQATAHGLATYRAVAEGFKGQALVAREASSQGLDLLRAALLRLHAEHYELHTSAFESSLAVGLSALGRDAEALHVLEATIRRVGAAGPAFDMPELLRQRGELRALNKDPDGALASVEEAIALAERQTSLSWRLRAETTRVALEGDPARRGRALDALEATYGRFKEGFGTADLRAARQLLADRPPIRTDAPEP